MTREGHFLVTISGTWVRLYGSVSPKLGGRRKCVKLDIRFPTCFTPCSLSEHVGFVHVTVKPSSKDAAETASALTSGRGRNALGWVSGLQCATRRAGV